MDNSGHSDLINNGFDYMYIPAPDYCSQDTALRASLAQFQTYPRNFVQGMARLVFGTAAGGVGFGFNPMQPPQIDASPMVTLADQLGGGVAAGQMYYMPLLDNGVMD